MAAEDCRAVETRRADHAGTRGNGGVPAVTKRVVNGTGFSAQEFLGSVCETVRQTFAHPVDIVCKAGDATLSNDAAMPRLLSLVSGM